jgi:hypothetical protein
MNDILITIMLFFATWVIMTASLSLMLFFFLLTRELIRDHING